MYADPAPLRTSPMSPKSPLILIAPARSMALGNRPSGPISVSAMSTIVRKRSGVELPDGVYRVVVAQVEPGIASRFTNREDLIRIGFDVLTAPDTVPPRIWLVTTPHLQSRLLALVEAVLNRKVTDEEEDGFDLEALLGREVCVVMAGVRTHGDATYSRIITFLPATPNADDHAS